MLEFVPLLIHLKCQTQNKEQDARRMVNIKHGTEYKINVLSLIYAENLPTTSNVLWDKKRHKVWHGRMEGFLPS